MHIVLLFLLASLAESTDVPVTLSDGSQVVGSVDDSGVQTFLGIPYAVPPVGTLRFRDTRPIGRLPGVFRATAIGNICYQAIPFPVPGNQSEDCLNLNVYTPSVEGSRAVMVYIHGGAFMMGSGSSRSGKYFASKHDVVLVTINYRLNAFGFLYDGTTNAPGSMGLKDQQLAMQWVQKNIGNFGGDAQRVTLFGGSAGSQSISHHTILPSSRGLFRRAIMQSGTANGGLAYRSKATANGWVPLLATTMGCPSTGTGIACLQKAEPSKIVQAVMQNSGDPPLFAPVFDGVFFPVNPTQAVESGMFNDVDMIAGNAQNEGWFFLPRIWQNFPAYSNNGQNPSFAVNMSIYEEGTDVVLDADPLLRFTCPSYREAARTKYLQLALPPSDKTRGQAIANMLGDMWFIEPAIECARRSTKKMYYYEYRYVSDMGQQGPMASPAWMGAVHGSDEKITFGQPYDTPDASAQDKKMSDVLMSYWSSFAKTGTPSAPNCVSWPEFKSPTYPYLILMPDCNKVEQNPRPQQVTFWEQELPQLISRGCDTATVRPTGPTGPGGRFGKSKGKGKGKGHRRHRGGDWEFQSFSHERWGK